MCERASLHEYMCARAKRVGNTRGYFRIGISEGSEREREREYPGDRLVARPIVGADQRAEGAISHEAKMRAIFDIRGTFIAALLSCSCASAQVETCY